MALGETDYGLYGVVGGLTAFVIFFFDILSGAVGRFYAITLGKYSGDGFDRQSCIDECRRWFSLAMMIHTIVPVVLLMLFYPIGEWAIRFYLTIPADRVHACLWVFRFGCITMALGMFCLPFNAMYTAKQCIAELTLYSFVTISLNAAFLYYMITHPGIWLVKFAFWTCLLSVIPKLIIMLRACVIFPECRFTAKDSWDWSRYKSMLSYTGWNTIGSLNYLLRSQGVAILINKYFGPAVNAAMAVANSVSGQAQTMSNSMQSALYPVINMAVGAKDYEKARLISYRFCKFGMLLFAFFMVPLILELRNVLTLWLKNPPEFAVGLCMCVLIFTFIDKNSLGHAAIVAAEGRIKWYQITLGIFGVMTVPLAWMFCCLGCNVYFVGLSLVVSWGCVSAGRIIFARYLVGMSIRYWLKKVALPVYIAVLFSLSAGAIPRFLLPESIARIGVTTLVCELVLLPVGWLMVLDKNEKIYLMERFRKYVRS